MDGLVNFALLGKLLVVAILAPAWLPVVRELWKEINASLAEEGGVFGELPTEAEAKHLVRARRVSGESLISVPRAGRSRGPGRSAPSAFHNGPETRGF